MRTDEQGFVPECTYPGKYPGILVGYGYLPFTRYLPELDIRCLENTQLPEGPSGYTHVPFRVQIPFIWPYFAWYVSKNDPSFSMDRYLRCVSNLAGIDVLSSYVQWDWCLTHYPLPEYPTNFCRVTVKYPFTYPVQNPSSGIPVT